MGLFFYALLKKMDDGDEKIPAIHLLSAIQFTKVFVLFGGADVFE